MLGVLTRVRITIGVIVDDDVPGLVAYGGCWGDTWKATWRAFVVSREF